MSSVMPPAAARWSAVLPDLIASTFPPLASAVSSAAGSSCAAASTTATSFGVVHGSVLVPLGRTRPWMCHLNLTADLLCNFALAVIWVVATGDPKTPLWMGMVVYACVLGAGQELEASYGHLLVVALAPFV